MKRTVSSLAGNEVRVKARVGSNPTASVIYKAVMKELLRITEDKNGIPKKAQRSP